MIAALPPSRRDASKAKFPSAPQRPEINPIPSPAVERRSRATEPTRNNAGNNRPAVDNNCAATADNRSEASLKAMPYKPQKPIARMVSPSQPARFTGVLGLWRGAGDWKELYNWERLESARAPAHSMTLREFLMRI